MIHQHFTLVNAMTVADNVMLALGEAGFWLDRKVRGAHPRAQPQLRLGLDPDAWSSAAARHAPARRDREGADARGGSAVLDEPTSILSPPEIEGLIGVMRKLRADGRAIIFITHKLGEVLSVCDEVVVLRDGKVVGPHAGRGRDAREASRT